MILLTVGSMFPFDRLVCAVDAAAAKLPDEQFVAQIGDGAYEPRQMRFIRFMPRKQFGQLLDEAEVVISHAGIGTIAETLTHGKPLLVLPRLHIFNEHVNDHQVSTARRFEQLGHVLVARSADEIISMLPRLRTFVPQRRVTDQQALARRVELALREPR